MGDITDKENTYSFWGHYIKGQVLRQFLWVFYIPFSNATLTQILFDLLQTWKMDSISEDGNTYSFWGHFVKGQGHGHFHGQFNGHNSYNIIQIHYKFSVGGGLTWLGQYSSFGNFDCSSCMYCQFMLIIVL